MSDNDETVRVTLRLGPDAMETIRWLQSKRNITTIGEVFKRAISTEKFLLERLDAGDEIILENKNTKQQRILHLGV